MTYCTAATLADKINVTFEDESVEYSYITSKLTHDSKGLSGLPIII